LAKRGAQVLSRAKALARERGQLGAKAVFEALLAEEGRGVEPFHPPQFDLRLGDKAVGQLTATADGGCSLILSSGVLPPDKLADFAKAVELLLSSDARLQR
jgi:hypothetical protein